MSGGGVSRRFITGWATAALLFLPTVFLVFEVYDEVSLYIAGGVQPKGWAPATTVELTDVVGFGVLGALSLAGGLLLAGCATAWPPSRSAAVVAAQRGGWSRGWRTAVLYISAMALTMFAGPVANWALGSIWPALVAADEPAESMSSGAVRAAELFTFIAAGGPLEEPVFVVAPLLLITACALFLARYQRGGTGRRFLLIAVPTVVIISALARAGLHLYQGAAGAAGALAWGAAACVIYWRWKSLLGLVAGHATYNVLYVDVLRRADSVPLLLVATAVFVALAVAALITTRRRRVVRFRSGIPAQVSNVD